MNTFRCYSSHSHLKKLFDGNLLLLFVCLSVRLKTEKSYTLIRNWTWYEYLLQWAV